MFNRRKPKEKRKKGERVYHVRTSVNFFIAFIAAHILLASYIWATFSSLIPLFGNRVSPKGVIAGFFVALFWAIVVRTGYFRVNQERLILSSTGIIYHRYFQTSFIAWDSIRSIDNDYIHSTLHKGGVGALSLEKPPLIMSEKKILGKIDHYFLRKRLKLGQFLSGNLWDSNLGRDILSYAPHLHPDAGKKEKYRLAEESLSDDPCEAYTEEANRQADTDQQS